MPPQIILIGVSYGYTHNAPAPAGSPELTLVPDSIHTDAINTKTYSYLGDVNGDGHEDVVGFEMDVSHQINRSSVKLGDGRGFYSDDFFLKQTAGTSYSAGTKFLQKNQSGESNPKERHCWSEEYSVLGFHLKTDARNIGSDKINLSIEVVALSTTDAPIFRLIGRKASDDPSPKPVDTSSPSSSMYDILNPKPSENSFVENEFPDAAITARLGFATLSVFNAADMPAELLTRGGWWLQAIGFKYYDCPTE